MCEEYDQRRLYLYKALTDMGFDCFEPEGAFYIFPDVSMFAKDGGDFVESLLKAQQVAVVPGDAFGESGKDHVRISYAYSMETLKKAMDPCVSITHGPFLTVRPNIGGWSYLLFFTRPGIQN